MTEFTCLADTGNICGEGIMWHPEQRLLYWTDINRGCVYCATPEGGSVQGWSFDQPATALALTTNPELLLLVLGGRIVLWSPQQGEVQRLYTLPEWPTVRCNDARVSPAGTLWFGTMQNNVAADGTALAVTTRLGTLQSLNGVGEVTQWDRAFGISNTVCWSVDRSTLFFGDTLANTIYRYPYFAAEDCVQTSHRAIFCEQFDRGLPDGSAVDEEGFLWNCRFGGGCVVRFALDGSVDRVVPTPVPNPTTCAFGGPGLRTLYVTSALESAAVSVPQDGGVFRMNAPVSGMPLPRFSLKNSRFL